MHAKPFAIGVASTAFLFAAMSFALHRATEPAARTTGTPLAASQLTLDRAFRVTVPVAPITPGISTSQYSGTMPSNAGMAVTTMTPFQPNNNAVGSTFYPLTITTASGAWTYRNNIGGYFSGDNGTLHFDPPVIVRPGESFTLSIDNFNSGTVVDFIVSGYVIYPGES